jgi:serine/threonine-protein kinase HipA
MSKLHIQFCPGTLANGFHSYSKTCLKRVFDGKSVNHILPFESPEKTQEIVEQYEQSRKYISISGVQEKYSLVLEKNKLRLAQKGERGTHILKPVPRSGNKSNQMPANEHLTMQIARQVFGIETAENALIFFKDGSPAYITKRFDMRKDGTKAAQEDFASIAGRTPQTHGSNYKYAGNYLELFKLMQEHLPLYIIEAPKLLKVLIFNYVFSNGDAHFKNFSLIETPMGDSRLSPAYDILNSRIHINDSEFALEQGLLPPQISGGKISKQFATLAKMTGINNKTFDETMKIMLSKTEQVYSLISASFLNETTKRNYKQLYNKRLKTLQKT